MVRRKKKKQAKRNSVKNQKSNQQKRAGNRWDFRELINFVVPEGELFSEGEFHGNIKWSPEQVIAQALIWSWQSDKNVTDAFEATNDVCEELGLDRTAKSYTSFMNAMSRYHGIFGERLTKRFHELAEDLGDRFFRCDGWVLFGFDGSRATAPRSVANEKAFCAPNYGHGKEAKYGKKKSQGLRRERNKAHKTAEPEPQVWITMIWHMTLRLPWTWQLGPSNSSERGHVQEILEHQRFPRKTLFCGDAGFVGYPLWNSIKSSGYDFLVRVGANVNLLTEQAKFDKLRNGIVLSWPNDAQQKAPLKLRLVSIKIGKTKMWLLTSVLNERMLTRKQIIRIYKLRWGIEVEFRGLKQTIDKHKLRCRNNNRLLAELNWSLLGMAIAELLALREQIPKRKSTAYDPKDRSLAKTLKALRKCMRELHKSVAPEMSLSANLARAFVQRYDNRTDKRARYRPKNPDKKPLGEPKVRTLTEKERAKLKKQQMNIAA